MAEKDTNSKPAPAQIRRRVFLRNAGITIGASAAAGWAALAPATWPLSLRDPDGKRGKPKTPVRRLPTSGFAIADKESARLGIAHGSRIDAVVRTAIELIGGATRYIKKGDIVVIKPNVAFERPAVLGATTNPDVMTALIRVCQEAGAAEVRVADNPIESPESCFERSGIRKAAVSAGARIYIPTPHDFETLATPGAKHISRWPFFWRPFVDATKVIGVAPVKDHNLCRASMTSKNWYGLLGGRRNQFHQDIHGIIADLALMIRPTFVLLDGTRVLFKSGPTGGSLSDVRAANTVVAATDQLAADAFGWQELLKREGEALPNYFDQIEGHNLGTRNWKELKVKRKRLG